MASALIIGLLAGSTVTYELAQHRTNNSGRAQFRLAQDVLFVEQTSTLKELRGGDTRKFQRALEEASWQQISRLSAATTLDSPIAANLSNAIAYHCAQLKTQAPDSVDSDLAEHTKLCKSLKAV
jgi:hypothetical protein